MSDKKVRLCAMAFAALLAATLCQPASAQQLSDFYGSKNIQFISLKAHPVLFPDSGSGGDFMFGFNTLSKRYEQNEIWKYYYGVELGGGGASWHDSDIGSYQDRNAGVGYVMVQIEGKMFHNDTKDLRPYVGWYGGIGYGSYSIERVDKEPEVGGGSLSVYSVGLETGTHIRLGVRYWLSLSVGMDLRAYPMGTETEVSYPAWVSIGIARWRGSMP